MVTDIIGEVVRDLANPSFQFQKRRNFEEPVDGAKPSEVAQDVASEAQTSAEPAKEEMSSSNDATAPVQDGEASATSSNIAQSEEIEKGGALAQSEKESADDAPEEAPWHILPEYRRRIFVDLKHPTHTILISALRGVCGMSVVERYDELKKFNVQVLSGTLHVRENSKKVQVDEEGSTESLAAASAEPSGETSETIQAGVVHTEPEDPAAASHSETDNRANTTIL